MTNYKLRYLPTFYNDLAQITNYIAEELKNAAAAIRLVNNVEVAIQERLIAPLSFEAYKSHKKRPYSYYRIYIRNYIVFYVVIDDVMEVRRLIYKKRDIEKELDM